MPVCLLCYLGKVVVRMEGHALVLRVGRNMHVG